MGTCKTPAAFIVSKKRPSEVEALPIVPQATSLPLFENLSLNLPHHIYSGEWNHFVGGGVAVMEGLAERISKRLSTPTIIANPFAGMSVASRVNAKALAKDAPAMMVACGLAMRRLDDG